MKVYIDDGHRPHRFPLAGWDGEELIAWVCQACGETVRDGDPPTERSDCPVDWRSGVK